MKHRTYRLLASTAALLCLSACSTTLLPQSKVDAPVAGDWQAPLPHQGKVIALAQWWQQQGDPVLAELIEAAQNASPSVTNALTRIEDARAKQATAYGALVPNLSAQASAARGISAPGVPLATTVQGGLQASWELDLVGANRAVDNAAAANVEGSRALWHDARVSVAAEVANLYYAQSNCLQMVAINKQDVASLRETARLAEINTKAGFTSTSVAALARASAAESNNRLLQQTAQCDVNTKALVALTAIAEPELRNKLATALAHPAQAQPIGVNNVPAQTIAQRPDVFAAERDVVVAAATVGSAKAQRYPRLTLNGSIGSMRVGNGGVDQTESTWSFGPLAISVPLYDGGQRAAAVKSSEAAYRASIGTYQSKVRQAVREVEEALVNLSSTEAREADAIAATQGYGQSLAATQAQYDHGLASLMDLEVARRMALSAQTAQATLQLQRNQAWVALYRALGGGFEPASVTDTATARSE
jgi:NodT family efflux transporter outer membrane factor (OMF) lipoprotein